MGAVPNPDCSATAAYPAPSLSLAAAAGILR